ncbi:MAG: polysaccharide biosynthesis C-terminal domain-containing protein [Bacteroidales bacterium]|nr:polysaccharide biosynthesis C-terminal domain-containing protein [Bacteroidales bacterium]
MGVIRKQTILGTIYTYLGAGLGVFTNLILLAWFYTPEQIGLLNVLISYSLIFAQFGNLGFDNVTTRLFTYFRNKEKYHFGYSKLLFSVNIIGGLIATVIFFIFYKTSNFKDELFVRLGILTVPLIWATLFFNTLDTYSRALYKSVRGTFLKEVIQRILIIIAMILFGLTIIKSFSLFAVIYVICIMIPTLVLFLLLIYEKELSFKGNLSLIISKNLKNEIINVSLFGIITIFSSTIVLNIDKIMLQHYINLKAAGIYSIAYYFGTIMLMPSRVLNKIASIIIADAWKNNDYKTINSIYYKSCINQFVFSLFLFILIYANLNSILKLLPSQYNNIQTIVFWILLGNFIDMSTGINNNIIATSPNYKMQSLFMSIFVIIIILTNAIFIPIYGIVGAAFASAVSLFLFNFIRWYYLYKKYKFQPFNHKFAIGIILGLIIYLIQSLIPEFKNFLIDIFVRSSIITIIFLYVFYNLKISEDMNERFYVYLKIINDKLKNFSSFNKK